MDDGNVSKAPKSAETEEQQKKRLLKLLDQGLESLEDGRVLTSDELNRRLDALFARHAARAKERTSG